MKLPFRRPLLLRVPLDSARACVCPIVVAQIKRRGEEILHFAARECHVACNVIRLPLLGVNRRGRFQGDLIIFTSMQVGAGETSSAAVHGYSRGLAAC